MKPIYVADGKDVKKRKQGDINETGALYLFTQLNECEQSGERSCPLDARPSRLILINFLFNIPLSTSQRTKASTAFYIMD